MTVGELLRRLGDSSDVATTRSGAGGLDRKVGGIAYDSRSVTPGAIFVALRGQKTDGAEFAQQSIERGAIAIVSQSAPPVDETTPWIVVPDARRALALLASAYYGDPSAQLKVVGITGTNGKTTSAYLISAIFDEAGVPCGRLGTVIYRIGTVERAAARTTPEAPDVQLLLREMVDRGCGACAMEVSSHALALKRVDGMRFAAAVFTNLTRDHLDFHGDMESYFLAKRSLFERLEPDAAGVINLDDARGPDMMAVTTRPMTYAVDRPADVMPGPLSHSLAGVSFEAQTPRGRLTLRSRLVGHFNVYNILAAVTTAVALDLPSTAIQAGVAALESVPGRFQVVSGRKDEVTVVVDYAHTDDALKNLLETARPLARGRLITVFGCGGDRDRTKRPLMGAVAARLSDIVVVTSDNPRSEDPERIIEEIKRGIVPAVDRALPRSTASAQANRAPVCLTIIDRRAAIERAVREAASGDLVVIAGKGHEKYQEIGGRTQRFDDVEVAREALARRRTSPTV